MNAISYLILSIVTGLAVAVAIQLFCRRRRNGDSPACDGCVFGNYCKKK